MNSYGFLQFCRRHLTRGGDRGVLGLGRSGPRGAIDKVKRPDVDMVACSLEILIIGLLRESGDRPTRATPPEHHPTAAARTPHARTSIQHTTTQRHSKLLPGGPPGPLDDHLNRTLICLWLCSTPLASPASSCPYPPIAGSNRGAQRRTMQHSRSHSTRVQSRPAQTRSHTKRLHYCAQRACRMAQPRGPASDI